MVNEGDPPGPVLFPLFLRHRRAGRRKWQPDSVMVQLQSTLCPWAGMGKVVSQTCPVYRHMSNMTLQ